MDSHAWHLLQGEDLSPFSQFRHLVKILPKVVFPTPRVPLNKYA